MGEGGFVNVDDEGNVIAGGWCEKARGLNKEFYARLWAPRVPHEVTSEQLQDVANRWLSGETVKFSDLSNG